MQPLSHDRHHTLHRFLPRSGQLFERLWYSIAPDSCQSGHVKHRAEVRVADLADATRPTDNFHP
jgi:hypothetical protein